VPILSDFNIGVCREKLTPKLTPTSRLSGDRRRVGSPARNLSIVDGQRDLPLFITRDAG
jgi:hypothetical protein